MTAKTLSRLLCMSVLINLAGCTNSEWLLSTIYNRMDNILARETKEYADFTDEQSEQIDLLADQYHLWHRMQHLPRYADLLEDVRIQLASSEGIHYSHVVEWSSEIEGYGRQMADCYPLNSAFGVMRSLSDEQVEQVLAHGIEEYDEFIEDRVDRTTEKRNDKRYSETRKWFGRFQLNLDKEQQTHLRETVESEQRLGGAGMELWKEWHLEFVDILRNRHDGVFEDRVGHHIQLLWTLQDDNFPDVVEHNRQLWIDYFFELAVSLSDQQKGEFSGWLAKMTSNLNSIADNVSEEDMGLIADQLGEAACVAPEVG